MAYSANLNNIVKRVTVNDDDEIHYIPMVILLNIMDGEDLVVSAMMS